MIPSAPSLGLLLAAALALPQPAALALNSASALAAPASPHWLARGGPGGGSRGGGRAGGFAGGGAAARPQTGFAGGGGFSSGNLRPAGGFSSGDRVNRVGSPSLTPPAGRLPAAGPSRPAADGAWANRPGGLGAVGTPGNRPINTGSINSGSISNRSITNRSVSVNPTWNRQVNLNAYNLNPGWARAGWGVARPWNWGWYGTWARPPWGWWGASAAAWGVTSLATAAMINASVNDAIASQATTIVVPDTGYELLFGTVQPVGTSSVSFVVTAGGSNYQLTADCTSGLIDGSPPSSADQAQLLNAACQVAFGNGS